MGVMAENPLPEPPIRQRAPKKRQMARRTSCHNTVFDNAACRQTATTPFLKTAGDGRRAAGGGPETEAAARARSSRQVLVLRQALLELVEEALVELGSSVDVGAHEERRLDTALEQDVDGLHDGTVQKQTARIERGAPHARG